MNEDRSQNCEGDSKDQIGQLCLGGVRPISDCDDAVEVVPKSPIYVYYSDKGSNSRTNLGMTTPADERYHKFLIFDDEESMQATLSKLVGRRNPEAVYVDAKDIHDFRSGK